MENNKIVYDGNEEFTEPVEGGFGYYGIVGHTEDGSKLQCHICGELFVGLTAHITGGHGLSAPQYKERFRLSATSVLLGSLARRVVIQVARQKQRERGSTVNKDWPAQPNGRARRPSILTLERDLRRGTAPKQLIDQLWQLKGELGRVPLKKDWRKYYKGKMTTIYRHFGGWSAFVDSAGMTSFTTEKFKKGSKEVILERWTNFYLKYGRVPTLTECVNKVDGLFYSKSYYSRFGSIKELNRLVLRNLGYKEPGEE